MFGPLEQIWKDVSSTNVASDASDETMNAASSSSWYLGRKRVIQVLFNMSVPLARVPEKASTLRDRSER